MREIFLLRPVSAGAEKIQSEVASMIHEVKRKRQVNRREKESRVTNDSCVVNWGCSFVC